MKNRVLTAIAAAVLGMSMTSTSAHALSVNPGIADWTSNSLLASPGSITGISGLTNSYSNFILFETGPFSSSYSTTYNLIGSDFNLTYGSGPSIGCPTCVLVVRGGVQNPSQYLFNIGSWSGTEAITGTGFWPGAGLPRITSVAIFQADPGVGVPEPASLLLLGAGLAGLGIWKRKGSKI
ncbi:MAG: PEP-CTERM sorting domain-containing protein [Nitrospira sp.]